MSGAPTATPALDRLIAWYESLDRDSLEQLESVYAPQARFRDPFNDVVGYEAIRRVFVHMFDNTEAPRFQIDSRLADQQQAFVTWTFRCRAAGRAFEIFGATRFTLDADGRVTEHRDYWDAAEGWYARVPVLGSLLAFLRRRFSAGG